MSTILDALKKSEQERKLANLPELSSMPLPEEEHAAGRIGLGLALLAVIVVIIIGYLIVDSKKQNQVLSTTEVSSKQFQSQPASKTLYEIDSKVYNYDDLTGRVRDTADSLNINVVSYTAETARRFAMIDSNLYRIGNILKLQNGNQVQILNIEANSVVFRYEDTQFRLTP